jgi:hypothetical protein
MKENKNNTITIQGRVYKEKELPILTQSQYEDLINNKTVNILGYEMKLTDNADFKDEDNTYAGHDLYIESVNNELSFYVDKNNDSISYIIIRNGQNENIAEVTVDTEDVDRIIKYKWTIGTWGYPSAIINDESIFLHRFILNEYDKNRIPDHINRNILDNRKSNLRIANKSDNAANSKIPKNNTSGVKGVSWSKQANGWRAYLTKHNHRYELGVFKDKGEAIEARLNAEKEYFGEFAPQINMYKNYKIGGMK